MSLSIKRIILFVSALSVSLFCAFFADQIIHRIDAGNEKNKNRTAVFTDGSEAFGISGCEIENKKVIITGPDPQFVLPGPDQEISRIDLLFSEPVAVDTPLQVFYAAPGAPFSEENSVYARISSGSVEETLSIPLNVYSALRFDFEEAVSLKNIYVAEQAVTETMYHPDIIRMLVITVACLIPLSILAIQLTKKKAGKE